MQPSVLCPGAEALYEVGVMRRPGPPSWVLDSPERCERVRAALRNSGFALPQGEISTVTPLDSHERAAFDLPIALAILLSDRSNEHLQRDGWIAWGALGLDGTLAAVDEPIVNGMGREPSVGRVWEPTDHIPAPEEDAVISLVTIRDLSQAWDAITRWVAMENLVAERLFEQTGTHMT